VKRKSVPKTYAFIDAANLFYGGEKSLGWKIDYLKLYKYLSKKYSAKKLYYFGGIEIYDYLFDYQKEDCVPVKDVEKHIRRYIHKNEKRFDDAKLLLLSRHLSRIKFFRKLQEFGYYLRLKPVKLYYQQDGTTQRKANCDVDMAFYIMREIENYDRILILSGDGDFLPVLKYLRNIGKEVIILSRGLRTAKEIRQFAGSNFRDFVRLEKDIKFEK
jgi:uncharacterized LabA/DUF88 family protein